MAGSVVLMDASVLYAAPARDVFLELAVSGLFRARWTERIQDEWSRHLLANRPDLHAAQLLRTRTLMNAHAQDCLVEEDEALTETLRLPDPDDRHVLAAALTGEAEVIVTFNLTDFPAEALAPYSITAQHPDMFLAALLERDREDVVAAARRVRARLCRPPLDATAYLAALERCGLSSTASHLSAFSALL